MYGAHRVYTLPTTPAGIVVVVQPNIGAREKWTEERLEEIVSTTIDLSHQATVDAAPELIVWPETALPGAPSQHPGWGAAVKRSTWHSGTPVLAGGVDVFGNGAAEFRQYNAAFLFDPLSPAPASVIHRKQKLIPMIEWVPRGRFLNLSRAASGSFVPGTDELVTPSPVGRFGVLLCYELTFSDMARTLRRNGADLLVTMSNDAWFGRTAAPYQHFAHAVLRAVENRVTVVRAANTGISGVVDPLGRVVTRTEIMTPTYTAGQVSVTSALPPSIMVADVVGPLALAVLLGLLAAPAVVRARPRSGRLALQVRPGLAHGPHR